MLKKAFIFICLISILIGCSLPPKPELEPVTVKLNWKNEAQFLGFYVAKFRGFYADEGLDVSIMERDASETNIPEQVANGAFDFGVGGAILQAQNNGARAMVVASVFQFGPETLFAKKESGILTPADLRGRSIAIKSPGWEALINQLLERYNMTLSDVRPVPATFDMTPFYNGEVDVWAGYMTSEVLRAKMDGYEIITLPLYEYGISSSAVAIYTSQDKVQTDPQLVSRFLRATMRGWDWAIKNPEEAIDEMLTMFPEMQADRKYQLASFQASIPLITPPGKSLGAIDCEIWLAGVTLQDKTGLCTTSFVDDLSK